MLSFSIDIFEDVIEIIKKINRHSLCQISDTVLIENNTDKAM